MPWFLVLNILIIVVLIGILFIYIYVVKKNDYAENKLDIIVDKAKDILITIIIYIFVGVVIGFKYVKKIIKKINKLIEDRKEQINRNKRNRASIVDMMEKKFKEEG